MIIRTTCPYCGVGCGIEVERSPEGETSLRGDTVHPANLGRLCSKGAALGETLGLEGRLLYPEIQGRRVDWDTALDRVAEGLRRTRDEHGPGALAFYVSGQLLTEDYYVANKLMKGFLGSANIDTNSRLCMASSVAGYKRALGADAVPCCYEDLELADLVVLIGSNAAWCHPVLFQRLRAAKEARPELRLVVLDPRRTPTCDIADLHLPLAPGTDTTLFNGLLRYLAQAQRLNTQFIAHHTQGFDAALAAATQGADPIADTAGRCGLPEAGVGQFFRWFAATERTLSLFSQGVNQWSFGTDKVNAIINVHLATGRIGRPGMGPFSLTGQPNAMGGREVGGLANQLAAHMEFDATALDRVQRFWRAERLASAPGLKAVDLFNAVGEGRIKAIWIMATNPLVSLPDADRVREALRGCELVVVSDVVRHTDTTSLAHILLPAAAWGEKDGTVTNSERRISRQRAFLSLPGEARPDWWILSQVARRLGWGESFAYDSAAEIFREHAALSAFENEGRRDFDLGGLAELDDQGYDRLEPVQWPVPKGTSSGRERLFADGRFFTPSGRASFVPIPDHSPANPTNQAYPWVLNSGRVRDHWHTLTRTGMSARLGAHSPEPLVEIHPLAAAAQGLKEGGFARLDSDYGTLLARVRLSEGQRPGSLFVPMHWSETWARSARVGALINPALDPVSGQPEFKHTPVSLQPWSPCWQGFLLSLEPLDLTAIEAEYLVRVRGEGFWRYELAGDKGIGDWSRWARDRLGETGDWLDYLDPAQGRYRGARLLAGRLVACLFVTEGDKLPSRDWLGSLMNSPGLSLKDRAALLVGQPGEAQGETGARICACFNVNADRLIRAIREQGLLTTEAIGKVLGAGTNCGSCLPEIRGLIAANS